MIELKENVIEKLKCSECGSYLSCAPIMMKSDGNSVCGRCELPEEELPGARNKVYEEVASVVSFPCRYREEGCSKKLPWDNVKQHEEQCDFRIYECPVIPNGTCSWTGTHSQLLDHYKDDHPDLVLDYPCKLSPDLTRDGEENFLMTVFGFIFLVQVKLSASAGKMWHCVRYLGNSAYTANFDYCLEIKNYDCIMMKSKRVSARDGLHISRNNSIEVNLKTLKEFLGSCERLTFTINIRKKGNICFRCKKELKPVKLYCLSGGYHCGNCQSDITNMMDFGDNEQYHYTKH